MGPSREACDRCHAMKTRCVRSPRSQVCVRCTRLGFSCHYSPPGRTGRPVGSKQKTATKRTKSSSRSSLQKPRRCTTASPCIEQDTACAVLGQISPALTADEPANSLLPINFSEFELFGSESSFDDGTSSMFLMDDLFQDVMSSNITNNTSDIATAPPSTVSQEPLEHFFIDSAPPSRHCSVASMEETEYVLLDAQGQLLHLIRALSSCSSFPQDVEEIYRITNTFVKVADDLNAGLNASSTRGPWCGGAVQHMLLSSCYMSLIQAFECLVGLLRRELGPTGAGFQPALGINLGQTQMDIPTTAHNVPFTSVDSVRLAMPHRVVAEINLHRVGQAVQHLRGTISRYATKIQPGLNLENTQSLRTLASSSSIRGLTTMAMSELEQREYTLLTGLQMPTV